MQAVIKASIAQRYAQIHYLYTAFYQANTEGLPIFRPMWMEFPTDTNTFALNNQFMWGDSFLVAPKLNTPLDLGSSFVSNTLYNVSVYLPPAANWYLQNDKRYIQGSSSMQYIIAGDGEYPTFIKAGSIIPILNYEVGRMSLLQAIDDNLRIEVYPDDSSMASGMLYIDDYTSHKYRDNEYSLVNYNWDGSILSVTKAVENAMYFKSSNKIINEISIMNVSQCPDQVINRWLNNTPYPAQGNVPVDFTYLPDTKELHLIGLAIPVEDGLIFNLAQEIVEVVWPSP